jgi:hypothetical protein
MAPARASWHSVQRMVPSTGSRCGNVPVAMSAVLAVAGLHSEECPRRFYVACVAVTGVPVHPGICL